MRSGLVTDSLAENFSVGSRITVWVERVSGEKVDLTLSDPSKSDASATTTAAAAKSDASAATDNGAAAGSAAAVAVGRVIGKTPLHVIAKLHGGDIARIHICDVSDKFTADALDSFAANDTVAGVRVPMVRHHTEQHPHHHRVKCQLSLRGSEMGKGGKARDPVIAKAADVKQNQVLRGYVCNVTDNGVFVALSRTVTARVKIANLSDLFIKDFRKVFKVGQLVKGRMLFVTEDGKIEFSLKRSAVVSAAAKPVRYSDLKIGQTVAGVVKRVESFGVFVAIDNSKLTGLAHISECADERLDKLDDVYSVGDLVKAKILRLTKAKQRISLGLKPSYFEDADDGEGGDGQPATKRAKGNGDSSDEEEDGETHAGGTKEEEEEEEEEEQVEEEVEDDSDGDGEDEEDDEEEEEYLDTTKVADTKGRLTVIRQSAAQSHGAAGAGDGEQGEGERAREDEDTVGQSEGGYTDASDSAKYGRRDWLLLLLSCSLALALALVYGGYAPL